MSEKADITRIIDALDDSRGAEAALLCIVEAMRLAYANILGAITDKADIDAGFVAEIEAHSVARAVEQATAAAADKPQIEDVAALGAAVRKGCLELFEQTRAANRPLGGNL